MQNYRLYGCLNIEKYLSMPKFRGFFMTKSELLDQISVNYPDMKKKQVGFIINALFSSMSEALSGGEKVEIRGFGSFGVRQQKPKNARNPQTGEKIAIPAKITPFFRSAKEIKESLTKQ